MLKALLLCFGAAVAFSSAAFDLQGHRGARGLAPENTLPAFERALELGVTTLELDIGVTADGVVVIHHDPYLNPATARDAGGQWLPGSKGPLIKTLTLAQLQAYDVGRINPETPYARTFDAQQARDGTRVPTLASLFDRVKSLGAGDVRFNIETKINPGQPEEAVSPEAMTGALLKVIQDAGMTQRVAIQSFDWRTLQLVQRIAPAIPTVYLTVQTANNDNVRDGTWTAGFKIDEHGSVPRLVKAAGGTVWSPNGGALTEALLKEAQALGLKVIPWTINNPADMERLIAWGVDGIITDYPDRLRSAMQARGLPLPKPVMARR
ncbi:glycerophosphodiester phosphodiesterase [Caenimonas soli]|uniref:glycerophosphodiester phosphodiesterase n=1 Tax=Caenimonas soli TaxID=2735555 RepID=UPI00155295A6|nr:glycerophosphodiester phosphodiesterase [Caenimonas soli]NPC55379.1 glycerophosphodiester phosphodiesterase [Caenimonas soli]